MLETLIGVLIVIVGAAALFGAIWFWLYLSDQRTQAMNELADKLGFEFIGQGDDEGSIELSRNEHDQLQTKFGTVAGPVRLKELSEFEGFDPKDWKARTIFNLIKGQVDSVELVIFDYEATTRVENPNTTSSKRVRLTVLLAKRPGLNLPALSFLKKDWRTSIRNVFLPSRVSIPEENLDPELTKCYEVQAEHPELAQTVIVPALSKALVESEAPLIEFLGDTIMLRSIGLALSITQIENSIKAAIQISKILHPID